MKLGQDKRERLARQIIAEVDRWNAVEEQDGYHVRRETYYARGETVLTFEQPARDDRAAIRFVVTIR